MTEKEKLYKITVMYQRRHHSHGYWVYPKKYNFLITQGQLDQIDWDNGLMVKSRWLNRQKVMSQKAYLVSAETQPIDEAEIDNYKRLDKIEAWPYKPEDRAVFKTYLNTAEV